MRGLVIIAMMALATDAFAHAKLKPGASLTLREDNSGIKTGPCGSAPRSANPTRLTAGQQLTVEWVETINHPGYFTIAFARSGDVGFEQNILANIPDTQDSTADLPHNYSTTITVPNQNCSACTIQLIQYMTENPASPTKYFSCADIQITGGVDSPTSSPSPSSSPAAVPSSSEDSGKCD